MGRIWDVKVIMIAPDIEPDGTRRASESVDNVSVSLPLFLVLFRPREVGSLGICQVSGDYHH